MTTNSDLDDEGPEVWQDEELDDDTIEQPSNAENSDAKLVKLYLFFLFMFQTLLRLSDVAIKVLLVFFSTFLGVIAGTSNLQRLQKFVTTLPRGLYAARNNVKNGEKQEMFFKNSLAAQVVTVSTHKKNVSSCKKTVF